MIETRSSHVPSTVRGVQQHVLLPAMLLASASVLLLSGCSASFNPGTATTGPAALDKFHGKVHGGQFPIQGATVSLYEIGATSTTAGGYAAALGTPLGVSGLTDANGNWSIPSPTACANASDEIYVVAVGGFQAQQGTSVNNTANVMTSVAGPCGAQFTHSFNIDELSTVATEYALSGFSADYQHVGTSATNTVGLINAFATVPNLVNLATGQGNAVTPAYPQPGAEPTGSNPDVFSSIAPLDALNTLGNILATCVNVPDGAGDANCTTLFSYTGGSNSLPVGTNGVQGPVATTIADAALYIAHNPGLPSAGGGVSTDNVATVWALPQPEAPFGPTVLSVAPNDWSLQIQYVGGGLGGATPATNSGGSRVGIDAQGNIWIPSSHNHTLIALGPNGAPITASTVYSPAVVAGGFTGGGLSKPTAIAFDLNDNIWMADSTNCVVGFTNAGAGTAAMASSPFGADCTAQPVLSARGIAVDTGNNIYLSGGGFIGSMTNSGTSRWLNSSGFNVLTGFLGQDYQGYMWFLDEANTSAGFLNESTGAIAGENSGTAPATTYFADFGPLSASAGGNANPSLWAPEPTNDIVALVIDNNTNTVATPPSNASGGVLVPTNPVPSDIVPIAVDGLGRQYFANSGTVAGPGQNEFYIQVYDPAKNQNSPSPGAFQGASQFVFIDKPQDLKIDQSGNLWVLNLNNYDANQSFVAGNPLGPYGGTYTANGINASNLIEYVGLAAPVNPVSVQDAANKTYATKP